MRIIKTPVDKLQKDSIKKKANIGCNRCPCCGESRSSIQYIQMGRLNKGIISGITKEWTEGFFKTKQMKADCYMCLTCGAEWESEPYDR